MRTMPSVKPVVQGDILYFKYIALEISKAAKNISERIKLTNSEDVANNLTPVVVRLEVLSCNYVVMDYTVVANVIIYSYYFNQL